MSRRKDEHFDLNLPYKLEQLRINQGGKSQRKINGEPQTLAGASLGSAASSSSSSSSSSSYSSPAASSSSSSSYSSPAASSSSSSAGASLGSAASSSSSSSSSPSSSYTPKPKRISTTPAPFYTFSPDALLPQFPSSPEPTLQPAGKNDPRILPTSLPNFGLKDVSTIWQTTKKPQPKQQVESGDEHEEKVEVVSSAAPVKSHLQDIYTAFTQVYKKHESEFSQLLGHDVTQPKKKNKAAAPSTEETTSSAQREKKQKKKKTTEKPVASDDLMSFLSEFIPFHFKEDDSKKEPEKKTEVKENGKLEEKQEEQAPKKTLQELIYAAEAHHALTALKAEVKDWEFTHRLGGKGDAPGIMTCFRDRNLRTRHTSLSYVNTPDSFINKLYIAVAQATMPIMGEKSYLLALMPTIDRTTSGMVAKKDGQMVIAYGSTATEETKVELQQFILVKLPDAKKSASRATPSKKSSKPQEPKDQFASRPSIQRGNVHGKQNLAVTIQGREQAFMFSEEESQAITTQLDHPERPCNSAEENQLINFYLQPQNIQHLFAILPPFEQIDVEVRSGIQTRLFDLIDPGKTLQDRSILQQIFLDPNAVRFLEGLFAKVNQEYLLVNPVLALFENSEYEVNYHLDAIANLIRIMPLGAVEGVGRILNQINLEKFGQFLASPVLDSWKKNIRLGWLLELIKFLDQDKVDVLFARLNKEEILAKSRIVIRDRADAKNSSSSALSASSASASSSAAAASVASTSSTSATQEAKTLAFKNKIYGRTFKTLRLTSTPNKELQRFLDPQKDPQKVFFAFLHSIDSEYEEEKLDNKQFKIVVKSLDLVRMQAFFKKPIDLAILNHLIFEDHLEECFKFCDTGFTQRFPINNLTVLLGLLAVLPDSVLKKRYARELDSMYKIFFIFSTGNFLNQTKITLKDTRGGESLIEARARTTLAQARQLFSPTIVHSVDSQDSKNEPPLIKTMLLGPANKTRSGHIKYENEQQLTECLHTITQLPQHGWNINLTIRLHSLSEVFFAYATERDTLSYRWWKKGNEQEQNENKQKRVLANKQAADAVEKAAILLDHFDVHTLPPRGQRTADTLPYFCQDYKFKKIGSNDPDFQSKNPKKYRVWYQEDNGKFKIKMWGSKGFIIEDNIDSQSPEAKRDRTEQPNDYLQRVLIDRGHILYNVPILSPESQDDYKKDIRKTLENMLADEKLIAINLKNKGLVEALFLIGWDTLVSAYQRAAKLEAKSKSGDPGRNLMAKIDNTNKFLAKLRQRVRDVLMAPQDVLDAKDGPQSVAKLDWSRSFWEAGLSSSLTSPRGKDKQGGIFSRILDTTSTLAEHPEVTGVPLDERNLAQKAVDGINAAFSSFKPSAD